MKDLLKAIWTSPAEIEARGHRIHKVNDQFTVMWADNADGDAVAYIGSEISLNHAVTLLINHICEPDQHTKEE